MHLKQFIPGPVEVKKDLLQAQTKPMIGHRSPEYSKLHQSIIEKFKEYMRLSEHEVFIFASSATGVMEGAVRNCVRRKILHTVCGAFSRRWQDISVANGKAIETLEVEYGQAVKQDALARALDAAARTDGSSEYDAVTITHNETSTGVMNPLDGLVEKIQKAGHLVLVDAVSSFGGTVIYPEELGIDVLIFGTQKCLALPPGLAFAVVSPRAMEISAGMQNKGYYFDFHIMKKYNDKWQTPATPAISLLDALDSQLTNMIDEGMEARSERHKHMAKMAREWCDKNGFDLLAEKGYESQTVTAVQNTLNIDITKFREELKERGYVISDGYGKFKGKGFRIGHMGDWGEGDVKRLLDTMTDVLREMVF